MRVPAQIGTMTSDEYPSYLTQLSVPDRLRLAAYEARHHGVSAIHLSAILDAVEALEIIGTDRFSHEAGWFGTSNARVTRTGGGLVARNTPSRVALQSVEE